MINCEKCNTLIPESNINTETLMPCSKCKSLVRTDIFPAAVRAPEPDERQKSLVIDDDAGCYFHPTKKAIIPCSSCGRFLCALCDIEMDGEHICFPCMESGKKQKVLNTLETYRFLPDSLAIRLSILPLISLVFTFFTCITAPASLYIAVRYWKSDSSITPRRKKWRFIVAFILSAAQIGCWIWIVIYLIHLS
ncbi:MAG: hypothetical protein GY729_01470 [Desulfobacteraceae bacterium]|nr:hypothetical protein [Desulfobacteraceae bacterium]